MIDWRFFTSPVHHEQWSEGLWSKGFKTWEYDYYESSLQTLLSQHKLYSYARWHVCEVSLSICKEKSQELKA